MITSHPSESYGGRYPCAGTKFPGPGVLAPNSQPQLDRLVEIAMSRHIGGSGGPADEMTKRYAPMFFIVLTI